MSTATLVIGESGTGKSASLRNFDPETTLLIQCLRKPLPFKMPGWGLASRVNPSGNIIVSDKSQKIIEVMTKTRRPVIVLDDFQYMMTNEFMARSEEPGYQKFSDIGRHAFDVLTTAVTLPPNVRVYILGHSATDDYGKTRTKTIGKLLDEKISVEGMFTIVLRTSVQGGEYQFSTRNDGADTTKTPMGLFNDDFIPNDLAAVDKAICEYYDLTTTTV